MALTPAGTPNITGGPDDGPHTHGQSDGTRRGQITDQVQHGRHTGHDRPCHQMGDGRYEA
jgi:hypothetical protein